MANQKKKTTPYLKILLIVSSLIIITVLIFCLFFLQTDRSDLPLLADLPQAYLLYDGLTINMSGDPEEDFWLREGFGASMDDPSAKDGKGREIHSDFEICFERWQTRGISIEIGANVKDGCQNLILIVNGKQVESKGVQAGYQQLTFLIPDEFLTSGENLARIQILGINDCSAVLDYIRWHIGQSGSKEKPEVDQRLIEGCKQNVIGSSGSYELNYYINAPANSHLVLDLGHDRKDSTSIPGRLRIWQQCCSSDGRILWEGEFPCSGNKKLDLDLNNPKEELILLSFKTVPESNDEDWLYIGNPRLTFPSQPPKPKSSTSLVMNKQKSRTIVLIFEDAMRKDLLPAYGNKFTQTPNLDKVTKTGVVFDNAYSPSNWTFPSFSSNFTSLAFTKTGATRKNTIMNAGIPTISEILGQNGWDTASITGNVLSGVRTGVARGFTHVFELYHLLPNQYLFPVEDYFVFLDKYLYDLPAQRDSFIVLHLMDTHTPFINHPEFLEKHIQTYPEIIKTMPWLASYPTEAAEIIPLLYSEVDYFDAMLAKIIEIIGKYRDLDNTIFILLSDHGQEIYEHGSFGHGGKLYEESVHIPLIVWGGGVIPMRSKQFVSSIDLMPTILDLAGIDSPVGIEGKSFAPKLNGDESSQTRPIFTSMVRGDFSLKSVIFTPWKVIYSNSKPELFNLIEDPREQENLQKTNTIAFGFMRGILKKWWCDIHSQGVSADNTPLNLSASEIEALKGLGYIQ